MIQSRTGSCHCGRIRFRCEVDLAPEGQRSPQLRPGTWYASTLRCNCSYCRRIRMWKAHVPSEAFALLTGEAALGRYRFGTCAIEHCFCPDCGVNTFSRADFEVMGGAFVCVNLACLDDVAPAELAAAPVRYEDGAADDWDSTPAFTSYL
ncbi:GFA family protein [Luteimonas sp. SDU101]|uniref:GFA family protein n=1 Tax=unclassified Luteimonas TaxID=2629088 RepID=UPI003EB8AA26